MSAKQRRAKRVLTDRQRRTLRWWLMLGLVPVALAALVVGGKMISVSAYAGAAVDSFEARAYSQAAQASEPLLFWNWLEPWKAPFALGVSLTMADSLDEGRANLEQALELHGEPETPNEIHEHCVIGASLATAIEKQGDVAREADDTQTANQRYNEALAVIAGLPEGCRDEPLEGEADTDEQLDAAEPRIEEKIEEESGEGDGEGEGGGEGEQEQQTPEEQLEEQNQDAQEQQQQEDQYDQGENPGGGGPSVEEPW